MTQYALGIDIGGTFTDIVLYDSATKRALGHKELTTPAAPSAGAITGIRTLCGAHRAHRRARARRRDLGRDRVPPRLRQPDARARGRPADRRAFPKPGGLAVVGGVAPDPRVRAQLDHGRQRLHQAAGVELPRP